MSLRMELGKDSYEIVTEPGCAGRADEYLNLDRKVLVVTDSGVPEEYAQRVAGKCREAVICRVPQGEEHKSIETWKMLLETMLSHSFGRKDCVAAVGGGCYGKSITDPCLGWEKSERLILEMAEMV